MPGVKPQLIEAAHLAPGAIEVERLRMVRAWLHPHADPSRTRHAELGQTAGAISTGAISIASAVVVPPGWGTMRELFEEPRILTSARSLTRRRWTAW